MIGVSVHPADRDTAREFFELCKTPWEIFQEGRSYDVLLGTAEPVNFAGAQLVLVFSGNSRAFNREQGLDPCAGPGATVISHAGRDFPIYGSTALFPGSRVRLASEKGTGESVIHASRTGSTTMVRVGYDLFKEVHHLLKFGQPSSFAAIPTIEFHIQLLRDLVTRAGIPFVEIPPSPDQYKFAACLTHDVDHPVLRNHRFDHTMFGFLQRATLGSVINFCRGRIAAARVRQNLAAAARLPLVLAGLARDSWADFGRFLEMEAGRPSTFFVIPRRDYPGRTRSGACSPLRASRYSPEEIAPTLRSIAASGSSVALHGLDAWLDAKEGRAEKRLLSEAVQPVAIENGVRMHWLCFDVDSPAALDAAGFTYDSSFGYNETIGFRAGTSQVYQPPGSSSLLELPLHVMDTALFYPSYMDLGEPEAHKRVTAMMDAFVGLGGVFTVNWHDRSIAPERLWGNFYRTLLNELEKRGAWFATASRAVAWFQMRRSAELTVEPAGGGELRLRCRLTIIDSSLPRLTIRIHKAHVATPGNPFSSGPDVGSVDVRLTETIDIRIKA